MKKEYRLKLKHLEVITKEPIDFSIIMKEVCGYNNRWLGRKLVFRYKFKQAYEVVKEATKIRPEKVEYRECNIAKPDNIDYITFKAMMELQHYINKADGEDFTNDIAHIIAISCYSEIYPKKKYNSINKSFIKLKKKILNEDMEDMLGIYNWISKAILESQRMWEERFLSVHIEDLEYHQAGGERMNQFNVLTTIKNICSQFNCSYDEAWQMPYTITQTNSYAVATQNHIQDGMRQIKESKMRRSREADKQ